MFQPDIGVRSRNRRCLRRRLLVITLVLTVAAAASPARIGIIRGHSMDPTLHSGQVVVVDRGFYRRDPLCVGDVVLFRGEHGVYVKRVYAVAGQAVYLIGEDGELSVSLPVSQETARRIVSEPSTAQSARLRRVAVPAGTFFALGDAIGNSEDSRDFGPVPVERILGRVLPLGASLAAPVPLGGGLRVEG
jgi:signal peptidase I